MLRTDSSNIVAKLVDRPKTLDVVWKEYVSGINATKPAIEYTHKDIMANATNNLVGIGLKNIQDRVEEINGSFSINSKPNQGTDLYIQIPIYD